MLGKGLVSAQASLYYFYPKTYDDWQAVRTRNMRGLITVTSVKNRRRFSLSVYEQESLWHCWN
jgi:hypothetical protein